MAQITTVSFFKYEGWSNKIWALSQMQLVHKKLRNVNGLEFYKMMGSGDGNGFSLKPDFSTFALLMVWNDILSGETFFSNHKAFSDFRQKTSSIQTHFLKAVKAHGLWDGHQPFELNGQFSESQKIAVLTRARIRTGLARRFWREVPPVSKAIEGAEGLIFSKGIGEWPILFQATLSIWENRQAMVNFAYKNPKHAKVIKMTRALDWYSEELFAEFELIQSASMHH